MRIPLASDITSIDYISSVDGGRFCKIRFSNGDVQLMETDEYHHLAHCLQDWSLHVDAQEADYELAERRGRGAS